MLFLFHSIHFLSLFHFLFSFHFLFLFPSLSTFFISLSSIPSKHIMMFFLQQPDVFLPMNESLHSSSITTNNITTNNALVSFVRRRENVVREKMDQKIIFRKCLQNFQLKFKLLLLVQFSLFEFCLIFIWQFFCNFFSDFFITFSSSSIICADKMVTFTHSICS